MVLSAVIAVTMTVMARRKRGGRAGIYLLFTKPLSYVVTIILRTILKTRIIIIIRARATEPESGPTWELK